MNLNDISRSLHHITRPSHPNYHYFQAALFGGITYLNTALFTSIPSQRAAGFIILAYAIDTQLTPLFTQLFEPYRNTSLLPLVGQVLHITASVMASKILCSLVGSPLAFNEIRTICLLLIVNLFVLNYALINFRQNRAANV